uniref:Nuclear receptor domain-containing protein n=1 Tax=Acrobeloides nanus TaxID=290746 RepID=A0A914CT44_9BILA
MTNCLICDTTIDKHRHFGVQICKACTAFFRRSIAEKHEYKCKYDGNCNIKGARRNVCRSCRLKRCFEVGLEREDIVKEESSPSTSNESPDKGQINPLESDKLPILASSKYPTIRRCVEGLEKFLNDQKLLIIKLNPSITFDDTKFRSLKKSEFDLFEKHSMSLVYHMLEDFYGPFKMLTLEHKTKFLISYCLKFSGMIKFYLTTITFPAVNDKRHVAYHGYCCHDIEYFLSEYEKPEEHYKMGETNLARSIEMTNKFKILGIKETETAILTCMLFIFEAEQFQFPEIQSSVERLKNAFFKEIHDYYTDKLGSVVAGIKFGNLFDLTNDMTIFFQDLHQNLKMCDLFVDEFYDLYIDLENKCSVKEHQDHMSKSETVKK